ncbi:MAG TPA: sigma-70 family RNA polymerase sigma factor [Kofleriaceae bacterium]|nr:sigma-70 family RNA polymerase sigma factor [Kofleriaceae bacterium]
MGHTIAMSDAELLEASRRGEHAAFGTIVERYQDVVCAVSYSRTRDQALSEDVAQETFLAAWRQLDQLREPGRLRSWLCGIAKNLAAKARKRSSRESPFVANDELALTARDNPFDAVSEAQAERVVGEALARVPETYRDVLVLYYREQRSIRDVAQALEITEAAALQRLARGRQCLAEGVTSLVERSLRGLPRKSLVAGVLAALPLIVPSRVDASPTHGGNMFTKIAVAVTALATAGTTAYVVHDRSTDTAPAASKVANAPFATPTEAPRAERPGFVAPPASPAIAPKHEPGAPGPHAQPPAPETEPVISRAQIAQLGLDRGASRGPASAPVVITVFTDMQCKYCVAALGSVDQLMDEYPNKLRVVVKQMPVHETAKLAAEAAFAADEQGKFWELHDLMLANQDDLSRDALLALGQQAGLDVAKLRKALDSHAYADEVARDMAVAKQIDVQATPSFIINGRKIVGNLPLPVLRAAIDAALADS